MTTAAYQFPRSVTDLTCPQGHVIAESQDRRLLEHLAFEVTMSAPYDSPLRRAGQAVQRHLSETCAHHWHDRTGDAQEGEPMWQCLWCNTVTTEAPA